MRALLDTSILIAHGESAETTPDLRDFDDVLVSSLSWTELTVGVHRTPDIRAYRLRSARLDTLRKRFGEGLPYDDSCDDMFDELLLRVAERGGDPRAHRFDRMLAATAMAHELALVTRNAADFAMFEGMLDVIER